MATGVVVSVAIATVLCGSSSSLCFFFSSRRRHTRSKRDWSSDVCSSDLVVPPLTGGHALLADCRFPGRPAHRKLSRCGVQFGSWPSISLQALTIQIFTQKYRSEERRVGKEWRPGSVPHE